MFTHDTHRWYCVTEYGALKIWGNYKNPLDTEWPIANWKSEGFQGYFPTLYCATPLHFWFFLDTQHRHMLYNINTCYLNHLDSDLRLLCVMNWMKCFQVHTKFSVLGGRWWFNHSKQTVVNFPNTIPNHVLT